MGLDWRSIRDFAHVALNDLTTHLTQGARVNCAIGTNAHTATVGQLCDAHLERLAQTLRDIETEAAIVSAVPSFAVKTGRTGGLASHRAPAVLDAIVATDPRRGWGTDDPLSYDDTASVLGTLHAWASHIRGERNLDHHGPLTITNERDLLSRHLDYAAAQPWAGDFYREMRALLIQLLRTNGNEPERPAGRCYLPIENSRATDDANGRARITDSICGGPIWIDDAHGHAHCGDCKATWDGAQLAHLHYELEKAKREAARPHTDDGRPMLTAQELVDRGLSSTLVNVRVTAHRRGHTAINGHYDPAIFQKVNA